MVGKGGKDSMNKKAMLLPLLAGFFVMGFGDIIGTVMNQVKAECAANADSISWLMPIFAYVWFLVISIPTRVLSGRIGRKNAVLVARDRAQVLRGARTSRIHLGLLRRQDPEAEQGMARHRDGVARREGRDILDIRRRLVDAQAVCRAYGQRKGKMTL